MPNVPIRTKALKPFSFSQRVEAKDASHDKLEIKCTNFIAFTSSVEQLDEDDIHGVRNLLGIVPAEERSNYMSVESYLLDCPHGWIFNSPPALLKHPQEIRNRPTRLGSDARLPQPLFGGKARFKLEAEGTDDATALVSLELTLNPTRFIRHQSIPNAWRTGDQLEGWRTGEFRTCAPPSFSNEEYPLVSDRSDNWLPDNLPYRTLAALDRIESLTQQYIYGVFAQIHHGFAQALSTQLHLRFREDSRSRSFHLRYVETYFEFKSLDPVAAVDDVFALLRSYSETDLDLQNYAIRPLAGRGIQENSPRIRLQIRNGVQLVIYAKTNRRIRFEVRHDLDTCKDINNGVQARTRDWPDLFHFLDRTRQDAADIVNNVLSHMESRASYPVDSVTVPTFLLDFSKALASYNDQATLLSLLIRNQRIFMFPDIRPQVIALRNAGILKSISRNTRRANVLTDRYRKAAALLGQEQFSLLEWH